MIFFCDKANSHCHDRKDAVGGVDTNENLWIATEGGGINFLNRETNEFKHYYIKDPRTGMEYNNVKSLAFLNQDTLLIGTHLGGLFLLNIKNNMLLHLNKDNQGPKIIEDIIPFFDKFLLGTKNGIMIFNPENFQFSPFITKEGKKLLSNKPVNCLYLDSSGILWIGTEEQGLFSYNCEEGMVKHYKLNPSFSKIEENISFIYEDKKFRLWIGSFGGGLYQYLRRENQFINYTMKTNLLPSDFILAIKESSINGDMWVSSSKGISRFEVENNRFYNYTFKNGFPLSELNHEALTITRDGYIFVGGLDGLISFKEQNLLQQRTKFKIFFTDLIVNNKKIFPNDQTQILTKDIAFTKKITLNHKQNIITICYSSSNYISTNPSKYRYMLENFDQHWINAESQNRVTYTNLDPGLYTFKVQGLNSVEDRVIDEKSLIIKVLPPPYKTWYALTFYFLTIVLIIWWLNKTYRSKIRLKEKIKTEQHKQEQIKKLNNEKLEFFTNISHELKTPLTLISGTLETILETPKIKSNLFNKLLSIQKNVDRLNNLISELLEFRKLEQGFYKLKIERYNLKEFLYDIFQSFIEYAQHLVLL